MSLDGIACVGGSQRADSCSHGRDSQRADSERCSHQGDSDRADSDRADSDRADSERRPYIVETNTLDAAKVLLKVGAHSDRHCLVQGTNRIKHEAAHVGALGRWCGGCLAGHGRGCLAEEGCLAQCQAVRGLAPFGRCHGAPGDQVLRGDGGKRAAAVGHAQGGRAGGEVDAVLSLNSKF